MFSMQWVSCGRKKVLVISIGTVSSIHKTCDGCNAVNTPVGVWSVDLIALVLG